MKLHLPKLLLLAVVAAGNMVGYQASGLTVKQDGDNTIISNDAGWEKTYQTSKVDNNTVSSEQKDATILNSNYTANGGSASNLANLKKAGDIILNDDGSLVLQTWVGDDNATGQNIEFDNDIYLGRTAEGNALRIATYCGDVILNGDINLLNNSTIAKETHKNRGTKAIINGDINGKNYDLTLAENWDATEFNGAVNVNNIIISNYSHIDFNGGLTANSITTKSTDMTINGGLNVKSILIEGSNSNLKISGESNTVGSLKQTWGLNLDVETLLEITGDGLTMSSGSEDVIKGEGTIKTTRLDLRNWGKYSIEINRLEIGEGGIVSTSDSGIGVYMGATTIATDYTWSYDKNIGLYDTEKGTTFEIGSGKTVTLSGVLSDKAIDESTTQAGKLVKTGQGELVLTAANTYSGGTKVAGGILTVDSGASLGSGDVEVDGGNLYLNGKDAVTSAKLIIKNGMVTTNYDGGGNGNTAINKATTVEIGGGGTLKLAGHDALGWSKDFAPKILLKGDSAEKVATLDIQDKTNGNWDVFTGVADIEMQGNSVMTGKKYSNFDGNLTVSGTNNKINVEEFAVRKPLTIHVGDKGALTMASKLVTHNDAGSFGGTITKTGKGTLTITGTENTYERGITVEGGTLVMEGAANHAGMLTMADGTELQTGTGVIKDLVLQSGSTLNAATAVTLGGSLELGTGLTLTGDLYASIMAMTAESEPVLLFTGVTELTLGAAGDALTIDVLSEEDEKDLNTWFRNVQAGTYYLSYDATSGNVYAEMVATVPEPTTATLSLLALCGLAMRRRRK